MRVFVTGASGFIGSAVVPLLINAGHHVLGLARSDEAAAALKKSGADAHRGDLADIDSLVAGVRASDGVIHLAYGHDFSKYIEAGAADLRAVQAIADVLAGSAKPFVIASGTGLLVARPGRLGTEADATGTEGMASVRGPSETAMISAAERGVRSCVVRLPPPVHDVTRAGLVTMLMGLAREKGVSAYIGEGANRWPAVHRLDAAQLFVLALQRAAAGSRLHAVAEEGIPMRMIAEAIGETLGVPARSIANADAMAHFGWLAPFAAIDNAASSAVTQRTMGWRPQEVGLLVDVRVMGRPS